MFIIFLVNLIIPLNKSFAEEIVNVFPSDGVLKNDTIYQLTEDTKLIKNLSVEKNTVVTIDLNGYVLCGTGDGTIINNNGNLTLKDSNPNRKVSYFEKSETSEWKWIENAIDDNNGAYIGIQGGILTGGYDKTKSTAASGGGGAVKQGVNAVSNVLNLQGGTVVGNRTGRAGGAFYGGRIDMSGGTIIGNYAEGFSAAISVSGNLNISGGEVSDENVTDSKTTSYPPNTNIVVGQNSDVYISGGIIKGLISTRDGGQSSNTFSMSGGELIGRIEIRNQMKTEISGGNLIGNIMMTSGQCTISETAVLTNGGIENGSCVYITDGIFTMKGGIIKDSDTEENGGAVKITNGTAKITGGIVRNCSATSGGAIYVSGGNFELSGSGIIENCTAIDGGAVFVQEGNVSALGGKITNCSSTSGGAICVSGGDFEFSGSGIIEYCSATKGGGVFVQEGNVSVLGGNITSCFATNGGGIYISNGNINMNGGYIINNQASENGGGFYASSDIQDLQINIFSGEITGNIASKNGGAIAVNMLNDMVAIINVGLEECYGKDDNHSHPIIENNTTNEYGGGFWLNGNQLTMNMYCGCVNENLAILEPGSANIYQTAGLATVYAGKVGEGIIVIGGKYISKIEEEIKNEVKIIYDLNISGNEQVFESQVTIGVDVYLPKSIFTRENWILVGWSEVKNPTETDVIYEIGKAYTIPDHDVTVYAIWLRIGVGDVITPKITSGRHFNEITGGTNLMLPSNSSFTIEMTVNNVEPDLYKDRTLIFNKSLIKGTYITMIDLTKKQDRKIYNYKVNEENITKVPLSNFIKNGTDNIYYTNSNETELVNESFIFIIQLPKENKIEEANQITLTRYSTDNDVAPIEQILSYTTTEERKINVSLSVNDNILNIQYEKNDSIIANSRYFNKSMTLVITEAGQEKLPNDIKLQGTDKTYQKNSNGEIIIPLGNSGENIEKKLKLISNALKQGEIDVDLNVELWISDSQNATKPFMGEKINEINDFKLKVNLLPAMKIETLEKIYNSDTIKDGLTIKYNSSNINNYKVNIEVLKKVGKDSYERINAIKKVNNITITDNVVDIKLYDNEDIKLNFIEGFDENLGTYRILFKIYNNNEIIYEIPYNFIINE